MIYFFYGYRYIILVKTAMAIFDSSDSSYEPLHEPTHELSAYEPPAYDGFLTSILAQMDNVPDMGRSWEYNIVCLQSAKDPNWMFCTSLIDPKPGK